MSASIPLKKVQSLVESSKLDRNEKALREAFQMYSKLEETSSSQPQSVDPELCVTIAEVATEFPNCFDIATLCADKYLALQAKRQKKDFLSRAYLVKATVTATSSEPLTLTSAQNSITWILQAITTITKLPLKTSNIIFNSSVLYWKICGPLFKDGNRSALLPSLETVSKALEDASDVDATWRIRCFYNLVKCYEESKLRDRAIKTVNQAAQLCTAGDVPLTVKEEILRLRIQLHASIPDAILKIRSEFPAVSSSTPGYEIAMHLRAVFILQCINCGITKDKNKVLHDLKEALSLSSSGDILVEVARNALSVANDYQLAKEAAESVINSRKSQNVKNRLRAELVLCHLMVAEEEQQFQRSSPVIEDSAMMGSLRQFVLKPFSRTVVALEEVGGTNVDLRRNLYYELAICEVEVEDALAKAKTHIEKAIALNQSEEFNKLYLEPLKNRIQVRINLYDEPERFEDQALLFIEQAKDAKEQDLQLNLLSRAMDALSHNQSPTKERGLLWFDIAQLASHYKFRDLAMKGIERFLEVEWNPSKTVNNSTPSSKEKVADKQLLRASAVIRFARAEILIQDRLNPEKQIKSIGSTTVARSKSKQTADSEDMIIKDLLAALNVGMQLNEEWLILNACIYVYNYFLPLFKQEHHVTASISQMEKATASLQECLNAINQRVTPSHTNICLLLSICEALVCLLEQTYNAKKKPPLQTAMMVALGSVKLQRAAGIIPSQSPSIVVQSPVSVVNSPPSELGPELKQAEEVCKLGLSWPADSMLKKKLLRMLARIQNIRGNMPNVNFGSTRKENETQVIVLLELMRNLPESNPKKLEYLSRASELLEASEQQIVLLQQQEDQEVAKKSINIELYTLLAHEAFGLKMYPMAKNIIKKVLDTVPEGGLSYTDNNSTPKGHWAWLSLAEYQKNRVVG